MTNKNILKLEVNNQTKHLEKYFQKVPQNLDFSAHPIPQKEPKMLPNSLRGPPWDHWGPQGHHYVPQWCPHGLPRHPQTPKITPKVTKSDPPGPEI